MNILVIGGTRYFGIPMVNRLLEEGHAVTLANRGITPDTFGSNVNRIRMDITKEECVRNAFRGLSYDVVIDKIGYCSNEIMWFVESLEFKRFVHMSTAGVYELDHYDIDESEFDPAKGELVWCDRRELSYDEVKRNAERALCQEYDSYNTISVRSPFVLGENDYTKRLLFYVEHIMTGRPMYIDNMDVQFCVSKSEEVADLLAELVDCDMVGAVNICSKGLISVEEIVKYVEKRTGRVAVLGINGDPAPYNGTKGNSLNINKAEQAGIAVQDVHSWIYGLLDHYIDICNREMER